MWWTAKRGMLQPMGSQRVRHDWVTELKWNQLCIRKLAQEYLSSVQFSHSVVSNSLWPHESQHARPPCPSPTPRVHSNSCPSSRWCHPAISSSVIPFSSCPQSLPASVFSNKSTLRMRWPKYWSLQEYKNIQQGKIHFLWHPIKGYQVYREAGKYKVIHYPENC